MTEPSGSHEGFRSGFVSIVGRPNVGKSTLLNQILRRKVSITSSRPQTTRTATRGVLTTDGAQLVFVDTPGLHKPQTALGRDLNRVVRDSIADVDVIVLVVDAAAGVGRGDRYLAEEVAEAATPVVVALNKIDLTTGEKRFLPQVALAQELGDDWPVYPVSAREGGGVGELVEAIGELLPEGPMFYPADADTDEPERHRIAELIREKLLDVTREEVPHSIAVVVEEMIPGRELTEIDAIVYVERESQKGIVIGKGGSVLKDVGSRARPEIERLVGTKVLLHLRVKVARDWQQDASLVQRFGYGER